MALPAAFRVMERSQVSPATGSLPETTLPLTFFDVMWLNRDPVERLSFYRFPYPTCNFMQAVVPALKSSLSFALQSFYPFAGSIRGCPGFCDKYEIHYVDGDSVSFALAGHGGDFEYISGSHARNVSELLPLIPRIAESGDDRHLLAVQVTLFPDRGVAVAVTFHHAVCDGTGFKQFMASWASACRSALSWQEVAVPSTPLFDETAITDPRGLHTVFSKMGPRRRVAEEDSATDVVSATFTLRREQIRSLKDLVPAKDEQGKTPFHCSTVVVAFAFAFAWVCHVRARGHGSDRITHFIFMADCKGRLWPSVPAEYLGNCVRPCFVDVKAEDLIRCDGFVVASAAIGRVIEELKADVLHDAEEWRGRAQAAMAELALTVAGSPRFRVYDTDMGWGPPNKVEVTSTRTSGAILVGESREDEGGGEIGLVLSTNEMEEFGAQFLGGLKLLI
ncbi:hypothetical protein C4D60_Mb04t23650 [Musa balbisiana]|uniref:Uncharacterized protein n=1 Tax=Musa balbisiana TaxID=52838 RepID=A0A4S8KE92_MUSBA|nr:hypothetical protein C4D60_Mb04t23650 [Musa balbisiana]